MGRIATVLGWMVAWTAIWMALWREASPANLASGILVAAILAFTFRPPSQVTNRSRVRPRAAIRFFAYLAAEIVKANITVAWEVLTPKSRIKEGIVRIPIKGVSDGLVALVTNSISLSPGTLTLDVQENPRAIYVHVLHLHDIEEVRSEIQHLEDLAIEAFGPKAPSESRHQKGGKQ